MKFPQKIISRKFIFISSFFLLLLLPATVFLALQKQEIRKKASENQEVKNPKRPEYAPGEVLIKLKVKNEKLKVKEEAEAQGVSLERQAVLFSDLEEKSLPSSLQRVNKRLKIRKVEKVFKGVGDPKAEVAAFKKRFPQRAAQVKPEAEKIDLSRTYKLIFDKEVSIKEIIQELTQDPEEIEYAEPNYIFRAQFVPHDPYYHSSGSWGQDYDDLWGLKKINMEKAWDLSQGKAVVVAVIDSGLDYNHPEIADNLWINSKEIPDNGIDDDGNGYLDDIHGWDFTTCIKSNLFGGCVNPKPPKIKLPDNDPMDGLGHGTHVSGTIAAVADDVGIIGVSPKAKIMPLKALDDSGVGRLDELTEAVYYAVNNGAWVINMSWGGLAPTPGEQPETLKEALDFAHAAGLVLVAAAGNDNELVDWFSPANYEQALTVAATDHRDNKSSFSNYGSLVDVAAPGGDSPVDDGPDSGPTKKIKKGRNILSLRAGNTDMYSESDVLNGLPPGICIVGKKGKYYRARGTSMAAPHVAGLAALILARQPNFSNDDVNLIISYSSDDLGAKGKDNFFGYGRINAYKAVSVENPNVFPHVFIKTPKKGGFVKGVVSISGSAFSQNFQKYTLEYGRGYEPKEYQFLYQSSKPIVNDVLFNWDTTQFNDGYGILRLTVSDANYGAISVDIRVFLTNEFLDGWPVAVGKPTSFFSVGIEDSPAIGDIDGRGDVEVVIGAGDSKVYAWHSNGSLVAGWPQETEWEVRSDPVLVDLDRDQNLEIVAASWKGLVYAWHGDGSLVAGWPKEISGKRIRNSPAVGDIDGDGKMEVVVGGYYGYGWEVKAWNDDGSLVAGWPKSGWNGGSPSPAVLADMDGDGKLEVLFNTSGNNGKIYAYHGNGSEVKGWPKKIGTIKPAAVGDINGDGANDIVVSGADYSGPKPSYKIFAWKLDGADLPGWPKELGSSLDASISAPVLGDLDGDGAAEILVSFLNWETLKSKVYIFNGDGNKVSGWPKTLKGGVSDPILGDLDGDQNLEIVLATGPDLSGEEEEISSKVYAWHNDGTLVNGWPKQTHPTLYSPLTGSPPPAVVGDINGDGNREIIIGSSEGFVYAWSVASDLPNLTAFQLEWPMFQHDPYHHGFYSLPTPTLPPTLTPTPTPTPTEACPLFHPRRSIYYGNVYLDNKPAPAGLSVRMYSPRDKLVGCAETKIAKGESLYPFTYVYGSEPPDFSGMEEGEEVKFLLNGLTVKTDPSPAIWYSGKMKKIDLYSYTITPTLTPTPVPTSTPTSTPTPAPTLTPTVIPTPTPAACLNNSCDVNNDGEKNTEDYSLLISCLHQPLSCCPKCDFNCDGVLNTVDVVWFSDHCQQFVPSPTLSPVKTPSPTPLSCPRGNLGNLDCSLDGCIYTADFELFRQDFGKKVSELNIPPNHHTPDLVVDENKKIDTADYEILRNNFGTCLPGFNVSK